MNRRNILNQFSHAPADIIALLGVLMVFFLGFIDHATGYELSFSIFYLLPIMMVAWFGLRRHAVLVAFISAAMWLWADLIPGHRYSSFAVPVWNAVTRLGFFLLSVYSFSRIREMLDREKAVARVDFLTGALNSRAFREKALMEIARASRFRRPVTIAYMDIDNFKTVNDTRGHSEGDQLLRVFAETIQRHIREIDIFARIGGDEFVILMSETDATSAAAAMRKIQNRLQEMILDNNWQVTFSIGVVVCYTLHALDDLIKEADNLMYTVKEHGKNSIAYKILGGEP
jgi:diguanylate cyclase (GGDEF)-like protein